jgi:hypothetical protein
MNPKKEIKTYYLEDISLNTYVGNTWLLTVKEPISIRQKDKN